MILSEAKARDLDIQVKVYRTEAGAEVDFIVQINGELFAVEVKATKTIGFHDLRGLKSFADFYKKPHTKLIIFMGDQSQQIEDVKIVCLVEAVKIIFS